ncbi:putative ATP-dependent RNA helicase DDX10 [Chlorella vulgaris]
MPPKKHKKQFHKQQTKRSKLESDEIAKIEQALAESVLPRGSNPLTLPAAGQQAGEAEAQAASVAAKRFDALPISEYSKQGLKEAKYVTLTAVQRAALPHALCGRDVLGAAKTGSGKTLAFLLPVVEKLYRARWSKPDGLGALIISPTRELALQIFDELRKVGRRHDLSAGLLIGGKDVKEEQERVHGMNILVCTPGRLLQHMDETPGFDAGQLQILVLDEADRILDMGFSVTLNAIVSNIPRQRQTLLFSATQTKSVKDLARLSLKDPEYIAVHSEASAPTPLKLQQAYMECELQQKMDILWSFIKTHLKAKTIIFVSTCKQVRFLFEAFRKLRPGVPLRALHGKMNQYKRMGAFYEFCEAKAMVLFATDIAARGLDFPTVDWVVQADCPEDVAAYIHRVGRTARYVSSGKGLVLLLPSERDAMLVQLEEAKVPMKQLKHNPAKVQPVTPALQALLSKDAELKDIAQRALVSYLRSVFLQPNRAVFDVTKLPAAEYAYSMGLPTAPKLRFLKRAGKKMQEVTVGGGALEAEEAEEGDEQAGAAPNGSAAGAMQQHAAAAGTGSEDEDAKAEEEAEERGGTQRAQQGVAPAVGEAAGDSDSDGDDLMVVKRPNIFASDGEEEEEERKAQTPAELDAAAAAAGEAGGSKRKKKLRIKAHAVSVSRVVFDEDGKVVDPLALLAQDDEQFDNGTAAGGGFLAAAGGSAGGLNTGIHASVEERAAAARAVMLARDRQDREELRELRKQQRQDKRGKRLAREQEEAAEGMEVGLAGEGSDSEEEEFGGFASDSDSDDGRQRGGGGSDSDADLDLLASSDDEEEQAQTAAQRKRRRGAAVEVAHLGMLPAKPPPQADSVGADGQAEEEEEEEEEGQQQQQTNARKRRRRSSGTAGLSLADQEALALRLLQPRR